jgi:hypothetical protein
MTRTIRKTTRIACLNCREIKAKCTGPPVCVECYFRGLDCRFVAKNNGGGRGLRGRSHEIIHNRKHRVTNILKTLEKADLPESVKAKYRDQLTKYEFIPNSVNNMLAKLARNPGLTCDNRECCFLSCPKCNPNNNQGMWNLLS